MKVLICIISCIVFVITEISGQKLDNVAGDWSFNLNTQVPNEAGSDYANSSIESSVDQTLISVSRSGILQVLLPSFKIRVRADFSDGSWPSSLVLQVRRTGTGRDLLGLLVPLLNGPSGGENYQNVTSVSQDFFTYGGLLTVTGIQDIPIQYKIEGLSVLIPVGAYSATITYTISGL